MEKKTVEKIAIIDLGSNSARLVLVNVLEGGYFYVYDELKESVRLAQDTGPDGQLNMIRIEQTMKTLKMFKKLCDSSKVDKIYAFATAAVRRASNQRSFVEEVRVTCGFDLRILDSELECKLVYRGVINSLDVTKGLIMDIGGGSTQLVYYNRRNILGFVTIPYGAVVLTDILKDYDLKPEEKYNRTKAFFKDLIAKDPAAAFLKNLDPDTALVGVGGSFRNLGKISRITKNYPLDKTHNYVLDKSDFYSISNKIKKLELDKTMKIRGLSSVRADIFPSALAAIDAVMDFIDFEKIVISGSGIREGTMYTHALPSTVDRPITDILGHSLYSILKQFDENTKNAEHIYDLALQLYTQLKVLHKLPKGYIKILRTAALLHNTGNRISYYDHHKHSRYIILNSKISGLSHKDIIMAAFTSELHRKKDINLADLLPYKDIITSEDVCIIYQLGVLLRISASLDRSKSQKIKTITCDVLGDSVILQTAYSPGVDKSLEIKDALTAGSMFKKAYRKNLQIL